jgi:predicted Zn-dependent protease
MSAPDRDLDKLDPTFRERVVELLRRMRDAKHDAVLWRRGGYASLAIHRRGVAIDVIERFSRWNPRPEFWAALGEACEALGLTWGGHESRADRSLVRALPATEDAWVRTASATEIAERVAQHLDATDPARRPTVRDSTRAKAKP